MQLEGTNTVVHDGEIVFTATCKYLQIELSDSARHVSVTLSFEPISIQSIGEGVHVAQEIVDKKPVILEKLGRARGIVDVIRSSAEFVGEVRLTSTYDVLCAHAQSCMASFIPLRMQRSKHSDCCLK